MLIVYPPSGIEQLFNLKADPDELNNLVGNPDLASILEELRARMKTWQKSINDPVL